MLCLAGESYVQQKVKKRRLRGALTSIGWKSRLQIQPKTPQQFAVEGLAFLSICCPENIRWVELSPEDLELRRTTLVVPWLVGLNCKDDVVEGSVELLLLKKKHFPHPGNFCSGIPENGTDTECSQADIAVTP